jgi:hypothetical protein
MKKLSIISAILLSSTFMPSFGMLSKYMPNKKQIFLFQKHYTTSKYCTAPKHNNDHLSLIEPEVTLKSPKVVLHDIKQYWNKIESTDISLQKINNPEEFAKNVQQARCLLIDALLASHMCNTIHSIKPTVIQHYYQKHRELRLKNHHHFMAEWHKEQMDAYLTMHYHIDIKTYDAIQRGIYHDMNGWDDTDTEECKQQLAHAIINLRQHYTYGKEQLKHIKNKKNE